MFENKKMIELYEDKIRNMESHIQDLKYNLNSLKNEIKTDDEILKICKDNGLTVEKLKNLITLKRCPYCLGEPFVRNETGYIEESLYIGQSQKHFYIQYLIECTKCHAQGPKAHNTNTAIEKWNSIPRSKHGNQKEKRVL